MPEYRDISNANIEVDLTRRGQVYQATHRGELRLSLMNRSFISFTYGGKHIEDFNLIATINNDRIERDGYASFNDTTTTYDNLDGQYYWGTHYKTNQLNFTLSTDGIDQPKLDEFLYWFHAGETRELILAEHPNRAILARVAEPPQISLLPFEDDVTITINSVQYKTKTTLYKGDIHLKLVMDEPHWYAIQNILGRKVKQNGTIRYIDYWRPPTSTDDSDYVSVFASQDALKILYEDGIPLGSMVGSNMLLGNGVYASIDDDLKSRIYDPDLVKGTACIDAGDGLTGTIAGAIIDASGNGISSLSRGAYAYFYYAGNAPAYTIIQFDITPQLNSEGYVSVPRNSFTDSNTPYNSIIVESSNKQIMQLTTPNILTSYNKAISIFKKMINITENEKYKYTWEDVRATIRDSVRHQGAREWAIKIIDFAKAQAANQDNADSAHIDSIDKIITAMSYFLYGMSNEENSYSLLKMQLRFNSQYGEAIGNISYRHPYVSSDPAEWDDWKDFGEVKTVEEDIGDMLNSNYIIIREKNHPNADGRIINWSETDRSLSHRIYHDFDVPLTNLTITYKNMYL